MRPDTEVFLPRFEMLCRSVLAPAIWPLAEPLRVSAWDTEKRFAYKDAYRAAEGDAFTSIGLPFAWGPVWSTRWFRLVGGASETLRSAADTHGRRLRIRVDTGTEATVWDAGGCPVRGLDEHRDAFELGSFDHIDVLIEAACNHPFGDQVFDWDSRERSERWKSETPGLVTRAEVAVFDETVWRLHTRMRFAADLLAELDSKSVRAQGLYASLQRAADAIDDADVSGSATAALTLLDEGLEQPAAGSEPALHCVAHAHIDTAWLWPIKETRRKTVRSWSNTLELMDAEPELRFICSQPQQYKWFEEDAPALFERLRSCVDREQWQPIGSMWIEPDALVPSGESLIRQILHGTMYFRKRFPDAPPQQIVFLPDTFGFPACLPTIMQACGLHTFVTNKIHWNQTNTFPHTTFRWEGLDGSHVLAHNTPGGDYNATLTPKELRRASSNVAGRDAAGLSSAATALQPFGFGDGGGGPTEEMLERVRAAASCDGLPRTRFGSIHEFVASIHDEDGRMGGFPVWSGAIDLELHRGTLTTQQWIKQANARAERGLRAAELFDTADKADGSRSDLLEQAWERVLLNQFHDILPGSSIAQVYDDARSDYEFIDDSIRCIEQSSSVVGSTPRVLNPSSGERVAVVELGGASRVVRLPAFSVSEPTDVESPPVEITGGVVSNGLVSFALDTSGRIVQLQAKDGVDLAGERPLNELRLYADRPMNWDAWDIDADYERNLIWTNDSDCAVDVVSHTPHRVEVRSEMMIGSSRCVQTFRVDAGSPIVEVLTEIDWQESHRLLRMESSPAVSSERVTVGTQFGHISRPTHRNTSWDRSAFEFACHRWMDLSEPGRGLSVLADAMYGRSAYGRTMGLSLLRAPTHPDPTSDIGRHKLRYAFMPHGGDWRAASVDHYAECFADPIRVVSSSQQFQPFVVEASSGARMEVAAFKRCQDNPDARVLRLVETRGMHAHVRVVFAEGVVAVYRVNALEVPEEGSGSVEGRSIEFDVGPFEIVTLLAYS